METLFTPNEREQLRQAWTILSPKIENWLTSAATPADTTAANFETAPPPHNLSNRLYWHDFIQPVKDVIQTAPGQSLTRQQVEHAIEKKLGPKFGVRDRKVLESGVVRWKTFVNQVGVQLRKEGFLDPNADRGEWRLAVTG